MSTRIAVLAAAALQFAFAQHARALDAPEGPVEGESLESYCASNPCRRDVQVRFLTDKGMIDERLELYWPAVQGNQISLLPGETVLVEAERRDGQFVNFKQVSENLNPERTITFDFQQSDGKVDMRLSVSNPFAEPMKFHLQMIDFQGNAHQTSSCPVVAGGSLYESWPHPIPELIVGGIRVLEESEGFRCEY